MKKLSFFFLLTASCIIGCSDDDSAPVKENPCNGIYPAPHTGIWNLTNISGGINEVNQDIEPGLITWKFEFCPKSGVTVVNNYDNEQVEDFLETGNYDISVTESDPDTYGCSGCCIVGGTNFGNMFYNRFPSPTVLTLDRQIPNGYTLTFTR